MARIQWGRVAAITAVFTLVGPFIGFLAALGWSVHQIPADEPRMRSLMLLSGVFTVIVGYVIGAPLAFLTGLGAGLASHRLRSGLVWTAAVTGLGVVIAFALHRVVGAGTDRNLIVFCSALASLACALTVLPIRPRPPSANLSET